MRLLAPIVNFWNMNGKANMNLVSDNNYLVELAVVLDCDNCPSVHPSLRTPHDC